MRTPGAVVTAEQGSLCAVLGASWRLLRRPQLLVPATLAVALVAAASAALDDGYALQILRGVSLLLACALAAATDDPGGEVLAASPYPRSARTGARVLAALAVIVPAWVATAVSVEIRAPQVPVLGVGVEALALGAFSIAIGVGLRAWRDVHAPSFLTTMGIVAFAFATAAAPRWYALQQTQTWGPPWRAAQIRWAGLGLVMLGIAILALRDPLSRSRG